MADQNDSAMAQMACCKTSKPTCGSSSTAMQCCQRGDHPYQQIIAKGPSVSNPLKTQNVATRVMALVRVLVPIELQPSLPPVPLFAGTTSPPILAFSTLLI